MWHKISAIPQSQAQFLAASIQQAIFAITRDTTQLVSHLDLVSPLEREQITKWNDYPLTTVRASVMNSVFDSPVRNPDCPAIHAWDGVLTITDLRKSVSRVSKELRCLGLKPGVMIPLCFEKSKWAIVAMLAVLQTGAGFVPIDPATPVERLKSIIAQFEPAVAITSASKCKVLRGLVETVVVVPAGPEANYLHFDKEQNGEILHPNSNDPAYCLFTSGSTGTPKGCIISYRSLMNIHNHTMRLKMQPGTRSLQFANFAFTISLYEIFGTLYAGGTVCIPSDEDRLSNLIGVMNDLQVTWAVLTPTTIRLLRPSDVPLLKTLVFGGEPIQEDLIEMWMRSVQLVQSYGMTETTGICSLSDVIQSLREKRHIGRPVNAKLWLVREDDHTKLAHIGAVAELIVEGRCLANGYLNFPQRTAESFITKPGWMLEMKGQSDTGILYKTGDLVRYASDGQIHYIGRKDRQIKIRGQRFELEDVEFHLAQNLPNCKKVIVEGIQPAGGGGRIICAFIQINDSPIEEDGELADWIAKRDDDFLKRVQSVDHDIRSKLPSYMIPQLFVPIAKVPITWSGKTNRQQLRVTLSVLSAQELYSRFGLITVSTSPREVTTDQERIAQGAWSQALGIDRQSIGASDDFFRLGGDSVAAMRVAALIRAKGFMITVNDIFENPQLSEISNLLPNRESKGWVKPRSPFSLLTEDMGQLLTSLKKDGFSFEGEEVEDILPVTGQQMFFFNQWSITCFPFLINGPVEVIRLKNACRAVIERHSVLRSIFWENHESKKVIQVIMKHIQLPFHEFKPDTDLEDSARQLANDAMNLPPLSTCFPLQFTLISKNSNEHAFLVRLSHSQMDGFSFPSFFRDLSMAYNECRSSLAPAPGFSDYMYFCKQELDNQAALDFWADYLCGSSPCQPDIGLGKISIPEDVATSSTCALPTLPPGITASTLVNSAFSLLLSQSTNQSDLVFGLVMSTRGNPVPGIDTILGPCSNINPLRVQLNPSLTGLELCQLLQEQYLRVSKYDWLDLEDIASQCAEWNSGKKLGYIVSHVDPGMGNLPLQLDGSKCSSMSPSVRIDLQNQVMVRVLGTKNTLEVQVRTSTAIMAQKEALAFGESLLQLVSSICRDPDRRTEYLYCSS